MHHYSRIQKLLHDLVLGKKFINKSLYEIEKIIYLKNIEIKDNNHLFITGLPRSGTTTLLNFINSSNQFASLSYKNMPFVLSPNFSKLFNKKKIILKERLHGDGILYDNNSPEALDEIFLNYDDEFIKNELINYIKLILLSEKKEKYLSKNNLNYKRVDFFQSIFPNCIFLITIRDPIYHANSLLKQHVHFSKLQKQNNFIRRYMNYLYHNEFGLDHKPWNKPIYYRDFSKIDYWIEQWFLFYNKILNEYKSNSNCYFIIYEELEDLDYLKKLLKKINLKQIKNLNLNYFKNCNVSKINTNISSDNYKNAKSLYAKYKREFTEE